MYLNKPSEIVPFSVSAPDKALLALFHKLLWHMEDHVALDLDQDVTSYLWNSLGYSPHDLVSTQFSKIREEEELYG